MRRRGRLSPVSQRRLERLAARAEVTDAALRRARYRCEAASTWPEVRCWGELDAHERVQRSLRPGGELDLDNIVVLCRSHHRATHDNIELAHQRGLLKRSWE